ncbi:DNA fragmentation factor subunit beta isoform X2 [Pseudophryne corroboree]|uniref:DNA fragmentation factor subunit beta isoform X2 n=1 Tax=Pseudophryne corroboree TaxID=495146 RepID=UPI003081E220
MGGKVSAQGQMKIFKVRTVSGDNKYGVACRDLRELRDKGCKKFQLPPNSTRVCLYEDGTEISNKYLRNLPDNTDLILLAPGETWHGFVTDIDRLLKAFYKRQVDVTEAARRLLSDEQAPKRRKILVDFISNLNENILAESREEDEPWFEGIESRHKNKSSYMRYSCESRIRSYMKEGPFDSSDCTSKHSINPYSNRESRIVFSTWNLDHRIEKKRTIVPCLAEAVKGSNGRQVNWQYFFNLLFTMENLKLVHIACHKKTSHNLKCDDSMIYVKRKSPKKIRK